MRFLIIFFCITAGLISGYFIRDLLYKRSGASNQESNFLKKVRKFDVYTIDNLSTVQIKPGKINIIKLQEEKENFNSYLFEFSFQPNPVESNLKKTTGIINLPKENKDTLPIVLMIRGYVDQNIFKSGDGTRNASYYFAENGYITIAPDFLGYGESDSEAEHIFESRFQTYVTVLTLLTTIREVKNNSELISGSYQLTDLLANFSTIFIWSHSNGGQIAFTLLEVTGKDYPTVLWAPVSKPFPYSILYYTDESDDGGKLIRRELANFEVDYDVDRYSPANFLDRIKAPLFIQQGTADEEVPVIWSNELVEKLKSKNIEVLYDKYPGTDHNMRPSWNLAIQKDLEFFENYLNKTNNSD